MGKTCMLQGKVLGLLVFFFPSPFEFRRLLLLRGRSRFLPAKVSTRTQLFNISFVRRVNASSLFRSGCDVMSQWSTQRLSP